VKYFISLVAVSTILCALIYLSIQQDMRLSANDPQIQLAEDAASYLGKGFSATSIISPYIIDISKSLGTFFMVFNEQGKLIGSSATLDKSNPQIPAGVFAYTKKHGEDRFTWQPKDGVRIATVMNHFSGKESGFVLVGRSLREVERREDMLERDAFVFWLVTILASGIILLPKFTPQG